MSYLRWLGAYFLGLALIPATPMLAWMSYPVVSRWVCPDFQLRSGICMHPWFDLASTSVVYGIFALGSAAFVALPALLAPSERRLVVNATFLIGAVLMAGITLLSGFGALVFTAVTLASGTLTRLFLLRRLPQ